MSFIQFFGLVPDRIFVVRENGMRIEALPPPKQGEVKRLLRVVRHGATAVG